MHSAGRAIFLLLFHYQCTDILFQQWVEAWCKETCNTSGKGILSKCERPPLNQYFSRILTILACMCKCIQHLVWHNPLYSFRGAFSSPMPEGNREWIHSISYMQKYCIGKIVSKIIQVDTWWIRTPFKLFTCIKTLPEFDCLITILLYQQL